MTDYIDTRIMLATSQHGTERRELLNSSDQLLVDLWNATVAAFPSVRETSLSHSFLDSMNDLIDMDVTRKAGRDAHAPSGVFLALFLFQFVAAAMISYVVGGRRSRQTAWVLFALLGFLLVLIIDVDQPNSGTITDSQEPMLQLQAFLRTRPPQTFDRFKVLPLDRRTKRPTDPPS